MSKLNKPVMLKLTDPGDIVNAAAKLLKSVFLRTIDICELAYDNPREIALTFQGGDAFPVALGSAAQGIEFMCDSVPVS